GRPDARSGAGAGRGRGGCAASCEGGRAMSAIRITYRKSAIGYAHDQRATLVALGLKRRHQTVEHEATPAIRGMVAKVRHLVSVDGAPADTPAGMAVLAAHGAGEASTADTEPS